MTTIFIQLLYQLIGLVMTILSLSIDKIYIVSAKYDTKLLYY